MTPRIVPCLRCEGSFERPRFGPPVRYCKPCRALIHAEQESERRREIEEDRALLHEVADSLRDVLPSAVVPMLDEYIQAIAPMVAKDSTVTDRMPAGSAAPGGSDDGMSTTYEDLAAFLDTRLTEVRMHQWFADNPHWSVGIHD